MSADLTACDGSFVCDATLHIHGCFSDEGRCEEPGQHGHPDPTAEHIDAQAINAAIETVARAIRPWAWRLRADRQRIGARLGADRVLTSTDPAVHAALAASLPAEVILAALVDRGVLTAEDAPIARPEGFEHWQQRWDGQHTHEGRRLVTPWEVAP